MNLRFLLDKGGWRDHPAYTVNGMALLIRSALTHAAAGHQRRSGAQGRLIVAACALHCARGGLFLLQLAGVTLFAAAAAMFAAGLWAASCSS